MKRMLCTRGQAPVCALKTRPCIVWCLAGFDRSSRRRRCGNPGSRGGRGYRCSAERGKLRRVPGGEGATEELSVTSASENHPRSVLPSNPPSVPLQEVGNTPRERATVGSRSLVDMGASTLCVKAKKRRTPPRSGDAHPRRLAHGPRHDKRLTRMIWRLVAHGEHGRSNRRAHCSTGIA